MRKTICAGVFLLLSLFFLTGCHLPTIVTPQKGERQWTVMVYMAADNDLQVEAFQDLNSMELVGSTEDVAVVVELDTGAGASRYLVTKDGNPSVLASLILEDLGRVDSGSVEELVSFLHFAREKYPAQHYALVLWNHGSGVKGKTRDISFDFSSRRSLTIPELRFALALSGGNIDLLGMDACLMQMIEVAYEVKDYARILVASQENVPGAGWDYETVLSALARNPALSPESLARIVVSSYIDYYRRSGVPGKYTLSAVDLSCIPGLVQTVDDLAGEILADTRTPPQLYLALGDSVTFFGDPDFVDLGDFARLLSLDWRVAPQVQEKARAVQERLTRCVLAFENIGVVESTGISIYFPYTAYERKYDALQFASATRWDDLVQYLMRWR